MKAVKRSLGWVCLSKSLSVISF